jgi:hypothetical protein
LTTSTEANNCKFFGNNTDSFFAVDQPASVDNNLVKFSRWWKKQTDTKVGFDRQLECALLAVDILQDWN